MPTKPKTPKAAAPVTRQIKRARRRLNSAFLLEETGKALLVALPLMTLLLLGLKSFAASGINWQAPLAGGFIAALLYGLAQLFFKRYQQNDAAAWLDLHNQAGGKVLAGRADAPKNLCQPSLSLRPTFKRLGLPALALAGALLWPWPAAGNAWRLDALKQRRGKLLDKLTTIEKKAPAILPAEIAAWREVLAQVEPQLPISPLAAVETFDHLQKQIDNTLLAQLSKNLAAVRRANQAAQNSAANRSDSSSAEQAALREMLAKLASELNPAELAALGESFPEAGRGDFSKLPPAALAQALQKLSASELRELMKKINQLKRGNCRKLGNCAGVMSPAAAAEMQRLLAQMGNLSEHNLALNRQKILFASGLPGPCGEIAPLSVGAPSDGRGAEFKPLLKPRGENFLPGAKLGESRAAPSGAAEPPSAIERTGIAAVGNVENIARARLSPRHQAAARQYFRQITAAPLPATTE